MKVKHMHIKIPLEQYEYLLTVKRELGIDMQHFIVFAIQEKINKLEEQNDSDQR